MASDLYGILHISPEATSEEIRKAYKKRALQTHPDRLPPNATAADKSAAEEQFRKVNNAYEILKDAEKRRVYDIHGVFPLPREEARPPPHYERPRQRHEYARYPEPFFPSATFTDFHFTDPFELFNSIFEDHMHGPHSRHWHHRRRATYDDGFGFQRPRNMHSEIDDLMANVRNMERNILSSSTAFGGMGMGFPMTRNIMPPFPSLVMDMGSSSGGGNWASESTMSQTVNGVTHTIQKRRDWDGNVHVTRTYPDGRKVVTFNGVEQPDPGHIPPPPPTRNNYLPPPPPPPPPYSPAPGAAMNYSGPSERPVIPTNRNSSAYIGDGDRVSLPVHYLAYSPLLYNTDMMSSPPHPGAPKKRWWNRA
ncbi:hypothetical protein BDP27DRAFT_1413122 [Rhodocollybia butyracea]|uniref:J domain-containing protein n=1 Tax=Rhodocollybia butyracea TaxID=206335 RepID=A0A9P5QBC7_9AGAR|nr:hypothetical protein BDP27DRAFT_1413122 [Rhodocollybia butyracea]